MGAIRQVAKCKVTYLGEPREARLSNLYFLTSLSHRVTNFHIVRARSLNWLGLPKIEGTIHLTLVPNLEDHVYVPA